MNEINLFVLSALLLIGGIYIFKKNTHTKKGKWLFVFVAIVSFLFLVAHGVASYFTGKGIDEAVFFHLSYGLGGAGFAEYFWLILGSLLILVLGTATIVWVVIREQIGKNNQIRNTMVAFMLVALSLATNPTTSIFRNTQDQQLFEKQDSHVSLDFHNYYKQPAIVAKKEKQKNIVFIFAEGLERTFFDQALFPGLTKNLLEIESKSISFSNIGEVVGTNWTVGGMTASLCGIPLFTPSHGNSMGGMDTFLPSARCLGDLLKEQDYQLTYIGGADTAFAGKGKLFQGHGFSEVLGRKELSPKIDDLRNSSAWGLSDDITLELVYQRFEELSKKDEKFGLFTLTLDTHQPNGHPSKSCEGMVYEEGKNSMLNAVVCSDKLIANFINRILQSRFADETLIVLASDHLAMRNTASSTLSKTKRKNLFLIIDPEEKESKEIEAKGSTLDISPTILPLIGFEGQIGLGRNLFENQASFDNETVFIRNNLANWRKPISEFWGFPKIEKALEIDIAKRTARIDERSFDMPILIELNDEFETTLKFQFYRQLGHKSLVGHAYDMKENTHFMLFDECKNVRRFEADLGVEGMCLIAGKGSDHSTKQKLDNDEIYSFDANEIRKLVGMPTIFEVSRIAHAGGGVGGRTYTNSHEALNSNYAKNFRYFELDFSFTKDAQLVCLHDWGDNFTQAFGSKIKEPLTLREFQNVVQNKSTFQKCTMESLADWMEKNPAAFIVTDVKTNNIGALKILLEALPEAKKRVIPQIYKPENFSKVKGMGFDQIIWTLYQYSASNKKVLESIKNFSGPFAVTMPRRRAKTDLPQSLLELKIPTFVHTINDPAEAEKFQKDQKVTEIYTDFLVP